MAVLVRQPILETVVERLIGPSKRDDIIDDIFWRDPFDEYTCDEVCNAFHLCLTHAQAGDFGGSYTQATWMIPVF